MSFNHLPQISRDSTEVVLENFNSYLQHDYENISSISRINDMFSIRESFDAFTETLLNGVNSKNQVTDDPYTISTLKSIFEQERKIVLESLGQPGQSSVAHGWMVNIFPILTDIYSDPVLNQIATVHVSKTPVFSLTRMFLESTVQNTDGTTTTKKFPSSTDLIRGKEEVVTVIPNRENDLFAAATLTLDYRTSSINKTFFHIFEVTVTDNDDGTGSPDVGTNTTVIPVTVRATGRANTPYTFTFKSGPAPAAGVEDTRQTVQGTILGQVNWDKGTYTYAITFANQDNPASTVTYGATNARCKVMFTSKKSSANRVDVDIKLDTWDIEIGVREDFRIPLHAETIQDYQSLYNIDMLRTMTLGIKQQILLNKDIDLSYMLQMYEPEMVKYGNNAVANLSIFEVGGGKYTPDSLQSVFRGMMAGIEETNTSIYKNMRAWPQYLVCGRAAHAALKTLQPATYTTSDPTGSGTMGYAAADQIRFGQQQVIRSDSIPSNRIYHIYKPGTDDPSRAAILDIVHWPLYVMEEITDAIKYTYLRSRSTIEIITPWALGYTELKGYEDYFGKL